MRNEKRTLLKGVNEIFTIFSTVSSDLHKIWARGFGKNFLSDCEFYENQHGESHILLMSVNEFASTFSTLII